MRGGAPRAEGVSVHDLYAAYPDVDVPHEQALLGAHGVVVALRASSCRRPSRPADAAAGDHATVVTALREGPLDLTRARARSRLNADVRGSCEG